MRCFNTLNLVLSHSGRLLLALCWWSLIHCTINVAIQLEIDNPIRLTQGVATFVARPFLAWRHVRVIWDDFIGSAQHYYLIWVCLRCFEHCWLLNSIWCFVVTTVSLRYSSILFSDSVPRFILLNCDGIHILIMLCGWWGVVWLRRRMGALVSLIVVLPGYRFKPSNWFLITANFCICIWHFVITATDFLNYNLCSLYLELCSLLISVLGNKSWRFKRRCRDICILEVTIILVLTFDCNLLMPVRCWHRVQGCALLVLFVVVLANL